MDDAIDPALTDIGADIPHQRVVFAVVYPERKQALVVAQCLADHPEGEFGHFYGFQLDGIVVRGIFRPWTGVGLGEMAWDPVDGWARTALAVVPDRETQLEPIRIANSTTA